MRYFRLRFGRSEVEIPAGDFIVGRSEGCGLILDDPMVSRRHALFHATEGQLFVEDLGSRNGVVVNRQEIKGRVELQHGDQVSVGDQLFLVVSSDERRTLTKRQSAVTLSGAVAERPTALGSRAALIEEAFATNNTAAVEFHLTNLMTGAMTDLQAGRVDASLLTALTNYALRAAAATDKAQWIDWVFHLHRAARGVLPMSAIDELFTLTRKLRYPYTPALRAYVDTLQAHGDRMSAPERFLFQRLEGLVRMLRA